MNIGILDQTCEGWSAGATFTRMMLECLSEYLQPPALSLRERLLGSSKEAPAHQVFFITRGTGVSPKPPIRTLLLDGETGFVPNAESWGDTKLDVILPVRDDLIYDIPGPKVGWIPDFQHHRLPYLFTDEERTSRDGLLHYIASEAKLILFSSEQANKDFQEFAMHFARKARVASFPSTLWATKIMDSPSDTVAKYRLPKKFIFVANQFWKHKNHAILPPALALVPKSAEVNLVLSGLPCDYRDMNNTHLSAFFQSCASHGVHHQVYFLGHLPYQEMVSLMRCSAAVLQPSLFEGWSTSIEDAKALGCPLMCSDIPVHREQAPEALGFFQPDSPASLAELIGRVYPGLESGPNPSREKKCLADAKGRSGKYARALVQIAVEATTDPKWEW